MKAAFRFLLLAQLALFACALTGCGRQLAKFDISRGNKKMLAKDHAGAIADYTLALEHDPLSYHAYYNRGLAWQSTGDVSKSSADFRKALDDYDSAVRMGPATAAAYNNRGMVKMELKDWKGAAEDFEKSLGMDANFGRAYYNRGRLKIEQKDLDGAIADFDKAITQRLAGGYAYYLRGVAKYRKQDFKGALEDLDEVMVHPIPEMGDVYELRARSHEALKDYRAAMADTDEMIKHSGKLSLPYLLRGNYKLFLKDLDGALKDYDTALLLQPGNTHVLVNRANIKHRQGDYAAALADCQQAIALQPEVSRHHYVLGELFMEQQMWPKAREAFARCAELNAADEGDYACLLSWICAARGGDNTKGEEVLTKRLESKKAPAKQPEDIWARKVMAFLLGRLNDTELFAAVDSSDAHREAGQRCEAWFYSGIKKLIANDTVGAADCFQKSIDTQQEDFTEYALAKAELKAMKK